MRCLTLILLPLLLAGSANAESASTRLVPADESALKRVPATSIYRPSWTGLDSPAAIFQTSHAKSDKDNTGVTRALDTQSSPVANNGKPYFDLNTDLSEAAQADADVSDTSGLFTNLAIWTVIVLCLRTRSSHLTDSAGERPSSRRYGWKRHQNNRARTNGL